MVAQHQPTTMSKVTTFPLQPVLALVVGALLGWGLSVLFPHLTGLAALALWPLGFAGGMVLCSLSRAEEHAFMSWSLLLVGQVLAVAGVTLLFLATLL